MAVLVRSLAEWVVQSVTLLEWKVIRQGAAFDKVFTVLLLLEKGVLGLLR